jgi:hypothetical protein
MPPAPLAPRSLPRFQVALKGALKSALKGPLKDLCALTALCALLASCDLLGTESARLRVLHAVKGVANIEVWIDDEFKLDVTPSELSLDLNLAPGDHSLSLRFTGSAEDLLTQEITLNERVNLLVIGGEGRDLELTEVNRPLPALELTEHSLEVVNLTGGLPDFNLTLSKQLPPAGEECSDGAERCPQPVLALPMTADEGDTEVSEFVTVTPGSNINISTDYLPRGDSDFIDDDLLGGETSIVLIRAVGGEEERPTLRLQLIRTIP